MHLVLRCAVLVATTLGLGVLAPGAPASAHPFGDPQTVSVETDADARLVHVRWRAGAADDLALLGAHLGIAPPVDDSGTITLMEAARAAQEMAGAGELRDYLVGHIRVEADGAACLGAVDPIRSLVSSGAALTFTCARPVRALDLSVTMLTDLHPAYRTFATGPAGQRAVYDVDHPTHGWTTSGTTAGPTGTTAASAVPPSAGRSAAVQLSAALGGVGALVGVGWLGIRLRRRSAA